ncbi:hypothetical protein QE152_g10690 [Popillia japonica]|uniref:Uncharacterized protein n=1 Tax=Popillia japonica TaxID=7064 RepID=A0AAW1LUZ0_POPJA
MNHRISLSRWDLILSPQLTGTPGYFQLDSCLYGKVTHLELTPCDHSQTILATGESTLFLVPLRCKAFPFPWH